MKKILNNLWLTFESMFSSLNDPLRTLVIFTVMTVFSAVTFYFSETSDNIMVIYILSVVIVSSLTTGYRWGVITAVLSVVCADFFFTPPYFSLNLSPSRSPLTLVIMLAAALITTALTFRIRAQARLSIRREIRTQFLYEITKKLLVTRGMDNIIALTQEYLHSLFDCNADFYLDDLDDAYPGLLFPVAGAPELTGVDLEAADLAFSNQIASGAGAGTNTQALRFYMPIISQGQTYGVAGLSRHGGGSPLAETDMTFLDMVISQVAMALERQRLSDQQRKVSLDAEKEKMRNNLLRAISHDLRAPLSGILDASTAFLESDETMTDKQSRDLVAGINEDSKWMIRMLDNLLSVTRMRKGETNVTKTAQPVKAIVDDAAERIYARFPNRALEIHPLEKRLIVPMDGTLIEQVLINLVENAIKHSKSDTVVELTVRREKSWAVFEVRDHGNGIPGKDLPILFEGGGAAQQNCGIDPPRGMGIGLSICNSIVKAHGGKISAENANDGGAVFQFYLPM